MGRLMNDERGQLLSPIWFLVLALWIAVAIFLYKGFSQIGSFVLFYLMGSLALFVLSPVLGAIKGRLPIGAKKGK